MRVYRSAFGNDCITKTNTVNESKHGSKADHFVQMNWEVIVDRCKMAVKKYRGALNRAKCLTQQDLMQEALMQVYQQADSYDSTREGASVEAFIYSCVKNAIIDALRRYGDRHDAETEEEASEYINPDLLPNSSVQPLVESEAFREQSQALELLDRLHGDKRLIVELKFGVNFYCEHSDEAIAKELGLSRPTVKKELNRALHEMQQYAKSLNRVRVAA